MVVVTASAKSSERVEAFILFPIVDQMTGAVD
jgi:hypothetical protein